MRVVIQCAGRKHRDAGRLRSASGEEVIFVARPECCQSVPSFSRYCKPDDVVGPGRGTWRDVLKVYNQEGQNPYNLRRAADLYKHKVYRALVDVLGWKNVFILSAGWGLIRSDFLTPDYDITFSIQGSPQSIRQKRLIQPLQDFNHLLDSDLSPKETVHFFGGRAYLPLYYILTEKLPTRNIIHHKGRLPRRIGFEYEEYHSSRNQNWHYAAAHAFLSTNQNKV
jgi:hypothetical protein